MRKNENIHLSFAALEQKKDFIEENFVRIREEMGKFQEELATLNASKGENHGEIEQKGSTDYRDPADDREFKGII